MKYRSGIRALGKEKADYIEFFNEAIPDDIRVLILPGLHILWFMLEPCNSISSLGIFITVGPMKLRNAS